MGTSVCHKEDLWGLQYVIRKTCGDFNLLQDRLVKTSVCYKTDLRGTLI